MTDDREQFIRDLIREELANNPGMDPAQAEEAVRKFMAIRPDARFDKTFSDKLRDDLLANMAPEQNSGGIRRFFAMRKKPVFAAAGLALTVILAVVAYQLFFSGPPTPGQFTLEALSADEAGTEPTSEFLLKSSQNLDEDEIRDILVFDPPVEFDVRKISTETISFAKKAYAAEDDAVRTVTSYRVIPQGELEKNVVYKVVIANKDYTDREYSWAFQVKAPFQVVGTHPRNEGTYVPTNSGIEIVFNRENILSPQNHFSITPNVQGRFEVKSNKLVFVPKNLNERTVYTVTISPGIRAEGTDDVMDRAHTFSFETGEEQYRNYSYLNFRNDFLEFIPDKKPTFPIYTYNLNAENLSANLYRLTDSNEFVDSYQTSREWSWGWTSYYRRNASNNYNPPGEKVLSFKPAILNVDYSSYLELPDALEPGYYILEVTGDNNIKNHVWVQISPIAHYYSVSDQKSILWAYDFPSSKPLTDAGISYQPSKNDIQKLANTDSDGLAQFPTPAGLTAHDADQATPRFLRIESGDKTSLALVSDGWYTDRAGKGDPYWDYLSTDRYTYQLTDSVNFWGVVRGRDTDIRQKKVTVGIYDSWSWYWQGPDYSTNTKEPLVSREVIVSSFDTISGQLSFAGISPGYYEILVTMDDQIISSSNIEILSYTKPAYQIKVTAEKNAVFAGEPVTLNIKAEFFDGTPVNDVVLKYSGWWESQISGEIRLDKNGEGSFTYTPPYTLERYNVYPRTLSVTFSPKLAEEGLISGRGNVLVFGPRLHLQAFQESRDGEQYTFKAKVNHITPQDEPENEYYSSREYIGDPAAGQRVEAQIVKVWYEKIDQGQYYDPINKVTYPRYRYDRHEEIIENRPGTTNQSGEFQFTAALPKAEHTYYQVVFKTTDRTGRTVQRTVYAHSYSENFNRYYDSTSGISVNLAFDGSGDNNSQTFSAGERVRVNLEVLQGDISDDAPVLFYNYQNSIQKAVVQKSRSFEETFTDEYVPSVSYRAVVLGPYGFEETYSITAQFDARDRKLEVEVTPDKEVYRPGEEAKLTVSVKDKNRNGIESQVNVAVVDEALYHLLPYTWQPDLLGTLYKPIYTTPVTGASRYAFVRDSEGAEGGGCFLPDTPILMADGSKKKISEIRVGDVVQTFSSEGADNKVYATVQGVAKFVVNEYLIINGHLKVTPEHRLFVNGNWVSAGRIQEGDVLIDSDGNQVKVREIQSVHAPQTEVYNIMIGKYHTYFADGIFVHNAEKGGGSDRTNFVDVALYETAQTGKNGLAQLSFTVPDNITSWRITTRAYDWKTLQAGDDKTNFTSSLPFFVDAPLNKAYLTGDKPILKIRAFGTMYDQNREVTYTASSESLNLSQTKTAAGNTAYFPLEALPAGTHSLRIEARQGERSDAIVKTITVQDSFFETIETASYNLAGELSGINHNENSFTTLTFMDGGRGKYYSPLLRRSYLSGIRSDQQIAGYLSQLLLAEYFDQPAPEEKPDLGLYHTEQGGLALFPYSDNDLELSAKLADLAAEYVYQDKLTDYFYQSLEDDKADIHRISRALYGLASFREPVLVKINSLKNHKDLDFSDRVYLALALVKLGDIEGAREIYLEHLRPELRFEGLSAWLTNQENIDTRIKLTGLVGAVASHSGFSDDAGKIWSYISQNNPKEDLDVLEELMLMRSELRQSRDHKVSFTYETSQREEEVRLEKGQKHSVKLSSDEVLSLRFRDISGSVVLTSHYERSQDPATIEKNGELSLAREYLVNGRSAAEFQEGDLVLVRLRPRIAASAIDGMYQITDYLPSGLKPITRTYELNLPSGDACNPIWYPAKVIDNTLYFNIWKDFLTNSRCGGNLTLNYYARVATAGEYRANPAVIQSLKNLNSLNISGQQTVIITQP